MKAFYVEESVDGSYNHAEEQHMNPVHSIAADIYTATAIDTILGQNEAMFNHHLALLSGMSVAAMVYGDPDGSDGLHNLVQALYDTARSCSIAQPLLIA
jgi:hypothetical protein